ncbi:hypothetical protein MNBD_GAMMA04-1291 [hydrothermal vent metagenome]|uniref:Prepilin-type N-terminal cleavage/methylation domain-containing protein n=1 Tax=hydrothermal vent metagenome TaxID=652676 RepID=A0A3B0WEU2_9ZZZZ
MYFVKNKSLSKQCTNKESGFSLVELGVVLGIVGILVAGSISVFSEQKTHVQWQESDFKLQFIKKALINHVALNKFLLCPDDGNGFENRSPDGSCQLNVGTVPFLSLGLSETAVQDSWGNRFGYAVNQDAVNVADMTNCPVNTACFFNNITPPAFDLTTLPVMGNAGNNNLRVCSVNNCTAATPDININSDNLVAVLIAFNENAGVDRDNLDVAEEENRDDDLFFVQAEYSEVPYFDDLIQTISANELKKRFGLELVVENVANNNPGNPNEVVAGSVAIAGGTGDNDRYSDNIGVNVETRILQFGAEFAGQTVTLTFDAIIEGGWEDAGANGGTPDTRWDGKIETQDRFMVGLNGGDVSNLNDSLVNLDDGVAEFDNHQVTESFYYDEDLDTDNTWYESLSYDVELDSSGNVKMDLAVFSTHVSETVTVENIKAVLYLPPPSVPKLPEVQEITGIPETAGLE